MNSDKQLLGLLTAAFLLLALSPAERSLAHPPQTRPATMPIIPQKDSPIQFEVKFWPTGAILAGESVTMELILRNKGTLPFRIPVAVPQIYEARINLEFDLPNQPIFDGGNAFYSALDLSPERDWPKIRQWTTVEPGETHVVRAGNIFGEASWAWGGVSVVGEMDEARIRVLVFLDDGNFVASDWVDFKLQQPDAKEEDWRDDITRLGVGDVSRRYGLLKQRVGDQDFWFIASESDGRLTRLRRLPMDEIRQVIPPKQVGDRLRNISVLGTDAEGGWHYYGPLTREEGQRGQPVGLLELGHGKTWRLQLTNETDVEIIEVTE